jgi:hypothetical protein
MKAIKLWGHNAYFDYVDRWMRIDDPFKNARGNHLRPTAEAKTLDQFVTEMWRTHRDTAPNQESSTNNVRWVWQGNKGVWLINFEGVNN